MLPALLLAAFFTPPAFNSADDLLIALETADQGLSKLRAEVSYDRDFDLAGERQTRRGEVFFEVVPSDKTHPQRREFCVRFDTLFYDSKTMREDREWHIFDGEWYAEKRERDHVISRKQVVAPGETTDPLKLGEGFFPFPIGQKKEEVLRRYDASLPPATEGLDSEQDADALKDFVQDAVQLKLVPKGNARDEFREIRLWYHKGTKETGDATLLLPRMSRVANRSGDVSTVRLINVKANDKADIPPATFDTSAPKEGWDVKVQPYRRADETAPASEKHDSSTPRAHNPDNSGKDSPPTRNFPTPPTEREE